MADTLEVRPQPVVRFGQHRPPSPRLSIVVVGDRTGPELCVCLERCRQQQGVSPTDIELILVNNGGLDPWVTACRPLLDVEISMQWNAGPSAARNEGARHAHAPLVGFVDDDGWVAGDWASVALASMEDGTRNAIRGRVVFKRHRLFTALANVYDLGPEERDDLLSLEGNLVVRRDAFLEVGGFDPDLFGGEGLELAFRLRERFPHCSLRYVPTLLMQHDYCDSWKKFYLKSRRYGRRDRARRAERPEVEALLLEHRRAHPVTKPWLRWQDRPLVWLLEQLRQLVRSLPHG